MITEQPPATNEFVAPGCELSTPRQITDHKVNGLNDAIEVQALDAPGAGGANHRYQLNLFSDSLHASGLPTVTKFLSVDFQNGPIKETGFNGFTNEALLAILIDRMRGFQNGPFKSRENALALTALEEALMWLQKRTRDRMARGVEGSHTK